MYIVFCGAGLNFSHRSLLSHLRSGVQCGKLICILMTSQEKREKSMKRESRLLLRSRLREPDKKNMEYYGGDY